MIRIMDYSWGTNWGRSDRRNLLKKKTLFEEVERGSAPTLPIINIIETKWLAASQVHSS